MSIAPGTRFGPYEITAPLGSGGMGEVYRARDTRLERDVAVKVLPESGAGNEQLRARFDREAKSISALNHPNICTLFDVGHQEGLLFLVMELIEGESLADRLLKGPLPPEQVLRAGAQIADALDHAHKQGIVHRDLKPGNIMLTKSGAKLLDFGLARTAAETQLVGLEMTSVPTQVKPLTQEGTILGTFQYMAPEQLEGLEADARTDIFGLGALLYEMATGKRAFEGKTKTSLIAAIVSSQPAPIATVVPVAPPALDHVVKRCLEKDPDDRWRSARDVAAELRWISGAGSQAGVSAPLTLRRKSRERIAWSLAGVMAIAAAGALVTRWPGAGAKQERPVVIRSEIPTGPVPPGLIPPGIDVLGTLAISPDGTTLAWLELEGGTTRIHLKQLDESDAHMLNGTEDAQQIFFSADSKWLGFMSTGQMKKISLRGGAPIPITKVVLPRGASWCDDESILFVPYYYGGIARVGASGADREVLTTPDRANGELSHRWPHILPGGRAFLFGIGMGSSWDEAKIAVQRVGSKERKVLINGGFDGRYLPTGHLVYARGNSLYAVRFNLETLEVSGDPVQVAEGVARTGTGIAEYSFSNDGLLVYRPARSLRSQMGALLLTDRTGQSLPFRDPSSSQGSVDQFAVSPAGDGFSAIVLDELWKFDLLRGSSTRLTSGTRAIDGVWSPDGKMIAFAEERKNPWNPYVRRADGSDPEQLLIKSDTSLEPMSWSPDGRVILMTRNDPETSGDILAFSVADKTLKPFVVTDHNECFPRFSPDGKWVAYTSDDSGRFEIYVRPFEGAPGRWQISTEGAGRAFWKKPDEIIFQSSRKVMSVHLKTSPGFTTEAPRLLFESPNNLVDVMPDGGRLLMRQAGESGISDDTLRLVTGWFSEVARKTGK